MMCKILILQRYYNLSDDETEFVIIGQLSFMHFLGLKRILQTNSDKKTWMPDGRRRMEKHTFFGYKDHIKGDTKTKLITDYGVTSAEVYDSQVVHRLVDKKEDGGEPLYADSAYQSEEIDNHLKKKGLKSRIHEKVYRAFSYKEANKG